MGFREKWLTAVEQKNSVLCAGLDPADVEMGRGETGLPKGANKLDWALAYIKAVAPYCAAIKPNLQYWKNDEGMASLQKIANVAHALGLVVIDDSKLADIGDTNDAGMFFAAQKADAVTLAPYAGNWEESSKMAKERTLGIISMCIMSNKEYAREKNKLVPVETEEFPYLKNFLVEVPNRGIFVPQFIHNAYEAKKHHMDGVVIGAPSAKNHIKDEEIKIIRSVVGEDMLVLLPGVGAQGGEAGAIWKHFGKDKVIVNVGRALMFPKGQHSTPEQQAETAKNYQMMLNDLRNAA